MSAYGYTDEEEVLHGISLDIKAGIIRENALVGPSQAQGVKSTIAKLLASFWDVGSGQITYGGLDIRQHR